MNGSLKRVVGGIKDLFPTNRRFVPSRLTDDWIYAYKLLLPALAMMLIVHFIPIVWGFTISFMHVDAAFLSHWLDAPFIGLQHYLKIFDPNSIVGSKYWFSLRQTLIFSIGSVIGIYLLGLLTAVLLNQNFRGRLAARTVVLVPWIAPVVVTLLTWRMMFLSKTGIVNGILLTLGVINEPILWLVGPNAIWAMLIANVWRNFPWAAIMLYAGLQSIPEQLYEAAEIDGAGRWAKFRYITLPQLKPVTAVTLVLMTLWSLINFTVPYVLIGQGASKSAEVLMLFIYNYAFKNYAFGLGAAMSAVLFLVAMILAFIYYRKLLDDSFQGGAI
jgi:multiple sugar transport system permease protein